MRICSHHHRPRRAFTLVELMVVVGIIVLLVGLTVGVMVTLNARSDERTTGSVIRLMDQAMDEWQKVSERAMSYGTPGQPTLRALYDVVADLAPGNADDGYVTRRALTYLQRNPTAQVILKSISGDLLRQDPANNDPNLQLKLLDPWDNEVVTVFPGSPATGNQPSDIDGTVRTAFENYYGVCVSRQPCFVSAGADRKFGDRSLASDASWKDNITSYPLGDPTP